MSKRATIATITDIGDEHYHGMELAKRFYMPYVIKAKCPDCGEVCEVDLTEHYLMYPCVDAVEELPMMCSTNHEFHVDVIVRLKLEAAPTKEEDDDAGEG